MTLINVVSHVRNFRYSKGFFFRPASSQSSGDCMVTFKIQLSAPLNFCHCDTFISKMFTVSPIGLLLVPCSPSAIFRSVISIIVNTVNRMFICRTWPHVGNKVVEQEPSFANGNPSTSVMLKEFYIRISAASLHCTPSKIFGLTKIPFFLALNTAARLAVTRFNISQKFINLVSTITKAFDYCLTLPVSTNKIYNCEPIEFGSNIFHVGSNNRIQKLKSNKLNFLQYLQGDLKCT